MKRCPALSYTNRLLITRASGGLLIDVCGCRSAHMRACSRCLCEGSVNGSGCRCGCGLHVAGRRATAAMEGGRQETGERAAPLHMLKAWSRVERS